VQTYLIYKYTSPSGKSYIGQTRNLKGRIQKHKTTTYCRAFANALAKYGYDNFLFEILEDGLSLEQANDREEYFIRSYDTLSPNGYNLLSGGLNRIPSEETRQKVIAALTGRPVSEETKRKIGGAQIGCLNHMFGKYGALHHNYKMVVSEETRRKSSVSHTGIKQSEATKSKRAAALSYHYVVIFPDNRCEYIVGMASFCRSHSLDGGSMSRVSTGKLAKYKGFRCIRIKHK
jgi:group I intron endonuclease